MASQHGESVMPLTRRGGVLGVNASGMGGGKTTVENNVIVVGNHAEAARMASLAALRSPEAQVIIVDSLTGNINRGGRSAKAIRAKGR